MPLKGHARNMVSAYARFLGLDSEELTKQFRREYHDFEEGITRYHTPARSQGRAGNAEPNGYSSGLYGGARQDFSQGAKSMWDKPIPSSELNRGYDSRSTSAQRMASAASRRSVVDGSTRRNAVDASPRSRSNSSYSAQGAPRPSLPMRLFGGLLRNPVVVIVGLIVLLVALFVVWALAANSCKQQENEIIPLANIGSVVTEENPAGDDGSLLLNGGGDTADANTGSFELAIEPAPGTAPWTEVTVDGESVCAEILSGRKTWTVTDSCTVMTGQPANLRVTRNGEAVNLIIDTSAGTGSLELKVIKPEGQP